MHSFNVTPLLLGVLVPDHPFLLFALELLRTLLRSRDFLKAQGSLLEFRRLFQLLAKEDDDETAGLILDCALLLMQNALFTRSLNKI